MIEEGTHTLYMIEAKRTEVADGTDGPYLPPVDRSWFVASHDAFCFPNRRQARSIGERDGWTKLESARKALAWARAMHHFPKFDGCGRMTSRVRYEFRIRESILTRKDRVLEETTMTEPAAELVDHPDHYGGADNPHEAVKVIEAWKLGFHLGNVVKYIARCGKKHPDRLSDLKKAAWYLAREISNIEKEGADGATEHPK